MSSKIDHKELQKRLKEDEVQVYLQEFLTNARRFYEDYGRQILFSVLLIAAILLGGYWYRTSQANQFQSAQLLFSNAVGNLQQQEPNYERAITHLDQLVSEYPNLEVTQLGVVLRGNCYFNMGNYQQALLDYERVVDDLSPDEEIPTRIAMVQAYRSVDEPQKAMEQLDLLEGRAQSESMKHQIVYLRGSCLMDLGRNEEAAEVFASIPTDSPWYGLAQDHLLWLQAEAAEPINS